MIFYLFLSFLIKKKIFTVEILHLILFFIYAMPIQSYKKQKKTLLLIWILLKLKKKLIPEKLNSGMWLI